MKDFLVFGTGDFADIVSDLIKRLGRNTAGYILDDAYVSSDSYNRLPVIPLSRLKEYSTEKYSVAIGFIGGKMYTQRSEKFELIRSLGYELENLIHPSAVLSTDNIGVGNIILEGCILGFKVKMGDGNIMWPHSVVNHHGVIGSFNNLSPSMSTSGGVTIGSHCFLGNNSTYKNKVVVADYTLVGAGAYIAHNTEEYGVYVPERTVKLNKNSMDIIL